jgi:hypothetical protein
MIIRQVQLAGLGNFRTTILHSISIRCLHDTCCGMAWNTV